MTKSSIRTETKSFSAAIGARITLLRTSRGYTQAELARALGVSQQAVFAYELGERRVSVLVLVKVATIFATSLEELMGLTTPPRAHKGRLSPKAMRHAERLQALSKTQQRFVIRIIDMLESANQS